MCKITRNHARSGMGIPYWTVLAVCPSEGHEIRDARMGIQDCMGRK